MQLLSSYSFHLCHWCELFLAHGCHEDSSQNPLPKWRNFAVKSVETPGFEPGASYMRSKRSTAELRPQTV